MLYIEVFASWCGMGFDWGPTSSTSMVERLQRPWQILGSLVCSSAATSRATWRRAFPSGCSRTPTVVSIALFCGKKKKTSKKCKNRQCRKRNGPFLPICLAWRHFAGPLPWGGPEVAAGSPLNGAQWHLKYCCWQCKTFRNPENTDPSALPTWQTHNAGKWARQLGVMWSIKELRERGSGGRGFGHLMQPFETHCIALRISVKCKSAFSNIYPQAVCAMTSTANTSTVEWKEFPFHTLPHIYFTEKIFYSNEKGLSQILKVSKDFFPTHVCRILIVP